jgi:hypothetical protein
MPRAHANPLWDVSRVVTGRGLVDDLGRVYAGTQDEAAALAEELLGRVDGCEFDVTLVDPAGELED